MSEPQGASYAAFLERKTQSGGDTGFTPRMMPSALFDFQVDLVEWALRKGRAAIFADCGLGKTPMQLAWAQNVVEHTNGRVLIVTPLAVTAQTIREGEKFGIGCQRSQNGTAHPGITVTNYERLQHFTPGDFAGVVADESSAIKAFDGKRRALVTEFLRTMEYRLLCTATAAPNDHIELGTSSEALGELGYMDMLGQFFKNDQGNLHAVRMWEGSKWRFKAHAERPFWRWVCSWARAMRRPSDLGYEDRAFILPDLVEREHIVEAIHKRPDMLFDLPAVGLQEQRAERRRTIRERCESVAERVVDTGEPAVSWCHLNAEADLLESLIPDAVQIAGSDTDEAKEEKFLGFSSGEIRVLVTKPRIGAFGLNWQHCAHMTFFPSHSFEQYYQGVRRCWRFGQSRPVVVDTIASTGERGVLRNLQRKSEAADRMFSMLVEYMNLSQQRARSVSDYGVIARPEVPAWLNRSK